MNDAGALRLSAEVAQAIVNHARAELPNEACGLLAGSAVSGLARAFHPARNAHASPYRYSLDPDDLVRITFAIERSGDELLAIVHSHPRTDATPSPTDRRAAELYPGTQQVIVGLGEAGPATPRLRAWRIGRGNDREVAVEIG